EQTRSVQGNLPSLDLRSCNYMVDKMAGILSYCASHAEKGSEMAKDLQVEETGPKYKQIYTQLHRSLSSKEYLPGEKLPSENELVEQFHASRPTVSRALAQLESEGLVERRAGSGTFVRIQGRQEGFVFGWFIPELGTTELSGLFGGGSSLAVWVGLQIWFWERTLSSAPPRKNRLS